MTRKRLPTSTESATMLMDRTQWHTRHCRLHRCLRYYSTYACASQYSRTSQGRHLRGDGRPSSGTIRLWSFATHVLSPKIHSVGVHPLCVYWPSTEWSCQWYDIFSTWLGPWFQHRRLATNALRTGKHLTRSYLVLVSLGIDWIQYILYLYDMPVWQIWVPSLLASLRNPIEVLLL